MTNDTPAQGMYSPSMRNSAQMAFEAEAAVYVSDHQIETARLYLAENVSPDDLDPVTLAQNGRKKIIGVLRKGAKEKRIADLPPNPPDAVLKALYNHTVGLGVLEVFLADSRINQINVQGPKEILVQVNGIWHPVLDDSYLFKDLDEMRMVVANIARRKNKDLSPYTDPILDLRFGYPPLRIHINQTRREYGLSVYIRRGRTKPFTVDQLIEWGDFDENVANLLIECAQRLFGVAIVGPVGTGKTVVYETYIEHMPHVPIVVVDDAGDFCTTHPYCAVFDLPPASYTTTAKPLITLGGLTRAALREGQVLGVAETRGAEEAGVLVADAPSMRAVATTVHGDTAILGLERFVTLIQRSDSYRGATDLNGIRSDLSFAFPLLIEMMQRGDRRFISNIYHNQGWDKHTGEWNLRHMVEAVFHADGRITWHVIDGDLDKIKPEIILDKMNRGHVVPYDRNNALSMLTVATQHMSSGNFLIAINILSQLVTEQSDNEKARQYLITALQTAGLDEIPRQEAGVVIAELNAAIKNCQWDEANAIVKQLNKKPAVYAYVRKNLPYPKVVQQIKAGILATRELRRLATAVDELLISDISWAELERTMLSLTDIDTEYLSPSLKKSARRIHVRILERIIDVAPQENRAYFQLLLSEFVDINSEQIIEIIGEKSGTPAPIGTY